MSVGIYSYRPDDGDNGNDDGDDGGDDSDDDGDDGDDGDYGDDGDDDCVLNEHFICVGRQWSPDCFLMDRLCTHFNCSCVNIIIVLMMIIIVRSL